LSVIPSSKIQLLYAVTLRTKATISWAQLADGDRCVGLCLKTVDEEDGRWKINVDGIDSGSSAERDKIAL
jgi:hypothetical protein